MKRGVDAKDWNSAADEMVDSRWYRQVGAKGRTSCKQDERDRKLI